MLKPSFNQKGFTLIEVLITMFILVVGLLGLAAMQLTVTQANQDSYVRSQAMVIVQSMADRIRLNQQYVNRTDYTSPVLVAANDNAYSTKTNYNFSGLGSCTSTAWNCYCQTIPNNVPKCRDDGSTNAASCSASELAQFDAWEMSCAGVNVHPDFFLEVACQDANSADGDACSAHSNYVVTASWPASVSDVSSRASCPTDITLGLAATGAQNVDRNCVLLTVTLGGSR
ncbi:type IV pilus modification protein PilV [Echinimonas agarilytica]|uniref:Type IV pilus modification protein PilV n=1 Tax=Echinimonas agarilytica TaxID=1215918 RepID=A0AA41W7F6_9GAMM|nr:type IV pilus modification protein PilV [Echinimonas agarilytica]MCM2680607.1 type IV pilus modification protein PilV [Echinimonas agarilytica]